MDASRIAAGAVLVAIIAVIWVVVGRGLGPEEPQVAVTAAVPPADAQSAEENPMETTSTAAEPDLPPVLREAPALEDIDGWLQSDVTSLEELRGNVVILQFWTYSCSNCKATLPYLQDIYATYHERGLEIVGVHAPEFDFEKDPSSILEAADRLGVIWPIALDTDKHNFHAWQEGPTAYWPRTYVIDQDGRIRFDHIGEGAYDELEATVAALLGAA